MLLNKLCSSVFQHVALVKVCSVSVSVPRIVSLSGSEIGPLYIGRVASACLSSFASFNTLKSMQACMRLYCRPILE